MHVDIWATNVERAQVEALSALDERRSGNHHIGLLGHIHFVGDKGHIPASGNAITEYTCYLRNALPTELAIHLKDVTGPVLTRESATLFRQKQSRAVNQIDHGQANLERDVLRTNNFFRCARPPRA